MKYFLLQAIPIADIGDEGSSFWMQIMVFLFVAVCWGVYSLTKNNRSKHKDQPQKLSEKSRTQYAKSRGGARLSHKPVAQRKGIVQAVEQKRSELLQEWEDKVQS